MEKENKKRIEFDITGTYFGIGLSWSDPRFAQSDKYIAFIIGCLVIRINF